MKHATILIVEDEEILAEIMSDWLRGHRYETITAENGRVALEKLATHPVDVIITDVRMPVMDGVTFLRKLKTMGRYKPSVILISGFNDLSAREAYGLGVEVTLEKPFEHDDMLTAVERILADRNELLSRPWQGSCTAVLEADFESLPQALHEGRIAFGRGGFCLQSNVSMNEAPVYLALHFVAEEKTISGCGFVRWSAPSEQQVGVELVYLDNPCREWVCGLIAGNPTCSFIPSSSHTPQLSSEKALAS